MELKPIRWVISPPVITTVVMGVELAVILDKDGSYTVSCTVGTRRPEIQKMFRNITEAKRYAIDVMLARELKRYFIGEIDVRNES